MVMIFLGLPFLRALETHICHCEEVIISDLTLRETVGSFLLSLPECLWYHSSLDKFKYALQSN